MNRRNFCKELSGSAISNSPSESTNPTPQYRTAESAGSPRQYVRGDRVLITSARAWLCYDEIGFYAVEAYCPHLGCLVRPLADGFACPCHQSHFTETGEREAGPAPRRLRYLYVDLDTSGCLVICREPTVDPNDRLIA
jgi:Rieske Fe-S protein